MSINFIMNINIKLSKCFFIIVICTFSFLTCSQDKTKILDDAKFSTVMSELMTIEYMAVPDTIKAQLIHNTLNRHKISVDLLESTIDANKDDPEYWQAIYDSVKVHLNKSYQNSD